MARVPTGPEGELTPQLFFSDGTAAGTRQVSRITGAREGYGGFIAAGGTILFQILDPKGGSELWRTDGTAAGPGGSARCLRTPSRGSSTTSGGPSTSW